MHSRGQRDKSLIAKRALAAFGLAVLLCGSALLINVAIESPSLWFVGWFTLVPLLLAIRILAPTEAAIAGAFWGVCVYGASDTLAGRAIPHSFLSLGLLTIIPALYAMVGAMLTRARGFHPLVLGLAWAGVELALQPLSLRHGLLASTQSGSVWIDTVGAAGGYLLVAVLVAAINAAILSVLSGVRAVVAGARVRVAAPRGGTLLSVPDVFFARFAFLEPIHPRPPPVRA